MSFTRLLAAAGLAVGLATSLAAPALAQEISAAERAKIESVVRDYLLKNPEILQEVMQELEKKQANLAEEQRRNILVTNRDVVFNSPRDIVLGNPDGDVTLVEFFDYNCGYCKKAYSDFTDLLKSDPKLRIVLRDFPVLGPGSVEASTVALALKPQLNATKYMEFHSKLLMGRGQANRARALDVAREVGADMAKLEKDMQSPLVRNQIAEVMAIAEQLKISGTPSYAVGLDVVEGAVGIDALRGAIVKARAACRAEKSITRC